MEQQRGFSLIEVLVSLILVASVALMLLQQQVSTGVFFNQLLQATRTSLNQHNQSERIVIHASACLI